MVAISTIRGRCAGAASSIAASAGADSVVGGAGGQVEPRGLRTGGAAEQRRGRRQARIEAVAVGRIEALDPLHVGHGLRIGWNALVSVDRAFAGVVGGQREYHVAAV